MEASVLGGQTRTQSLAATDIRTCWYRRGCRIADLSLLSFCAWEQRWPHRNSESQV